MSHVNICFHFNKCIEVELPDHMVGYTQIYVGHADYFLKQLDYFHTLDINVSSRCSTAFSVFDDVILPCFSIIGFIQGHLAVTMFCFPDEYT